MGQRASAEDTKPPHPTQENSSQTINRTKGNAEQRIDETKPPDSSQENSSQTINGTKGNAERHIDETKSQDSRQQDDPSTTNGTKENVEQSSGVGIESQKKDAVISLKLKNVHALINLKQKLKPDTTTEEFEQFLIDVGDINVKKSGSVGKFTTVKSVSGGILNIALLELTIDSLKRVQIAGRASELYYETLLTIYIIMITLEVLGILAAAILVKSKLRQLENRKWSLALNGLNFSVGILAVVITILGSVATALQSDHTYKQLQIQTTINTT